MKRSLKMFLGANVLVVFGLVSATQALELSSLTDLLGQLCTSSKTSGDSTLVSLTDDLASKATSLYKNLAGESAVQGQLVGAIQSMLGNKGASALGALSKLTEAKLTEQQMKLAKDVGNVGSAYLVQKNFASLEGAQGDVATIVNALRKGDTTQALPALQGVAQNAKLSPAQKQLADALVAQYAPPQAKKIGNAVKEGLKSLPSFGM